MTTALEGGEGSASRPGRSLPPGKTRYPLYRRLGRPQSRAGQVRKISPPPEFDLLTVQPVASHYTDYATRPTKVLLLASAIRIKATLFDVLGCSDLVHDGYKTVLIGEWKCVLQEQC